MFRPSPRIIPRRALARVIAAIAVALTLLVGLVAVEAGDPAATSGATPTLDLGRVSGG